MRPPDLNQLDLDQTKALYPFLRGVRDTALVNVNYAYRKYGRVDNFQIATVLADEPSLIVKIIQEVGILTRDSLSACALEIGKLAIRLLTTRQAGQPRVYLNYLCAIDDYCNEDSEFKKKWKPIKKGLLSKCPEADQFLSPGFLDLVESLTEKIEERLHTGLTLEGVLIGQTALLAFIHSYLSEDEEDNFLDVLNQNGEAIFNHNDLGAAENYLSAAIRIEHDFLRETKIKDPYIQESLSSNNPSYFATRLALAAVVSHEFRERLDEGKLIFGLLSLFFLKTVKDEIVKFGSSQQMKSYNSPLIFKLFSAFFVDERPEFRLKYQNEYNAATPSLSKGNRLPPVIRRANNEISGFSQGQKKKLGFLHSVFSALYDSDLRVHTQIALASKLAVLVRLKTGKPHEPVSLSPNPLSGNNSQFASSLCEMVFVPLTKAIHDEQGGSIAPAILDIVNTIYFTDQSCSVAPPGFDWPRQQNSAWSHIRSDSHLEARNAGQNWGGAHLWLFGTKFADALEKSITEVSHQHKGLSPSAFSEINIGSFEFKKNQTSGENNLQPMSGSYIEDAARLARFIFVIPRMSDGQPKFRLADQPLVQDELRDTVLRLARMLSKSDSTLKSLYLPIYQPTTSVCNDNSFYGCPGSLQ